MRVLTYNTWLLPEVTWPRIGVVTEHLDAEQLLRAPLIGAAISPHIDVCVLQEVFDRRCRKALRKKMAHHPFCTRVLERPGLSRWVRPGGVVVCSKTPIEAEDQLVFSSTTGLDGLLTKGCLYARLRVSETDAAVHIFATHLQAHGGVRREAIRRAQLRELDRWRRSKPIRPNDVVLLVGDFNVPAHASDELAQMLQILGAEIPFVVDASEATYDPLTNVLCRETEREWLDYVLTSQIHRPVRRCSRTLFQPMAVFGTSADPRPLSDHYGVEVDLRF